MHIYNSTACNSPACPVVVSFQNNRCYIARRSMDFCSRQNILLVIINGSLTDNNYIDTIMMNLNVIDAGQS